MVELVDTRDLKSLDRNIVPVQVRPRVPSFNNSNNKLNYAYILMQKGIQEKTAITKQFIIKKKQEYDKLISYID